MQSAEEPHSYAIYALRLPYPYILNTLPGTGDWSIELESRRIPIEGSTPARTSSIRIAYVPWRQSEIQYTDWVDFYSDEYYTAEFVLKKINFK